ncbi:hypothetical protein GCM10023200_28290 [Actinomycetospora chlora]|uniref:histidine kinase n=1 Tax=Actinomycetospora chlora TaxID=663608 RepID=A0ABP9B769_9PSEU
MTARPGRLLPELRTSDGVVVAVLLMLLGVNAVAVGEAVGGGAGVGVFLGGAVQTLPVLWRRERPVGALLVLAVSVPVVWWLVASAPVWPWAVLVFGVVRRVRPVPAAVVVTVTTLVAPLLCGVVDRPGDPARALGTAAGLLVSVVPVLGIAAVVAVVARARAAQVAVRRRAEERDRLAEALTAQRDRLAADLRDLVAVRVERVVARIRELADPEPARLAAVTEDARAALAGMRRALTLLRGTADPEPVGAGPAPGTGPRRWWPSRGGVALAGAVAGLVVLAAVTAGLALPHVRPGRIADLLALLDVDLARPLGLLPIAVQVLALAWWRRAPLPALVVATLGSAAASLLGTTHLVTETSWGVLVYGAGLAAPTVASALTVAGCTAAVLVTTLATDVPAALAQSPVSWVLSYLLVPAVWGLGVLQRRAAAQAARREADRAAERATREVRAQRLGLARELHDVLAHELSALVVTLNAARVAPDPSALGTIREAGERIAAALPTLLEGDTPPAGALDAAALETLVAPVRDAGLPVEVEVVGPDRPDRPEADVLAARIVTEALTNALRHAGPSPTRVVVRHDDDAVALEVTDEGVRPGHRPPAEGSGLGLVGMRERAALVGGTVEAGPIGAGWRVAAHLPRRGAGLLPEPERTVV